MEISNHRGMLSVELEPGYRFVVDTGSNISHIHFSFAYSLPVNDGKAFHSKGISGSLFSQGTVSICGHVFALSDLSSLLASLEDNLGLSVCGILGTDFLLSRGLVIDLKDMRIYERD